MDAVFIKPGELFVAKAPTQLRTILGSCVSVCVFDKKQQIGGMNHFLLWDMGNQEKIEKESDMNRYGHFAIPNLLKIFKNKYGSNRDDLVVKILGGADSVHEKEDSIGKNNAEMAKKFIQNLGLKIAGTHVGGRLGRKVEFNSETGEVFVKFIEKSSEPKIIQKKTESINSPIKVLIVDDSKPIRMILKKLVESHPLMKVIGEANHPMEAKEIIKKEMPDVITLDINMPFMDGVTYLENLMCETPVPTIMVTDYRLDQSGPVLKSLELGAFDYINKGELQHLLENPTDFSEKILEAVKAKKRIVEKSKVNKSLTIERNLLYEIPQYLLSKYVILIGASTGGTEAIKDVFIRLPAKVPPIVVVQHIPPVFSKAFADRLNELSAFDVKEAENNDQLIPNRALIAPGGLQMKVTPSGSEYKVSLTDDPPVNRFKPSVDYLFNSGQIIDRKIIAVLMTGMGDDGARGLYKLKTLKSAKTIVQDEDSCVVFGMPKAAIEMDAASTVCSLDNIAINILKNIK